VVRRTFLEDVTRNEVTLLVEDMSLGLMKMKITWDGILDFNAKFSARIRPVGLGVA